MNNELAQPNWYTRVCVIVFLLFLGGIVYWSFIYESPQYQITASILIALSLMVVAILADSFSSITFGTLFQLKKNVMRAENERKEAKEEARELRASLLNLVTSVHQSQVTTNITGMDVATLRRVLGVVEASPEEKKKAEEEKSHSADREDEVRAAGSHAPEGTFEFRRALQKAVKDHLFKQFIDKYKVSPLELRREVRFDAGIENIDPIMNRNIIYDGYVRTDQKEYFIETSPMARSSLLYADRLYVALAKVLFYRQVKKVDAELVFLQAALPEEAMDSGRSRDRFMEWFQPAIAGSLLRVEMCSISSAEFSGLKNVAKRNLS